MSCDFWPKSRRQERLWIELLRNATVSERFTLMRWMTAFTIRRTREEIVRANPDLSPEELKLEFIEVRYGKELAQRVRDYLRRR
jgi:hypothetical protein